ncbi:endonuclease/exonuclease/phosphatase family protein [Mangrovihabitans endophyticus]|uniref:Endonuclease n=1 Tax=Mangrovihabitans endophyticus TaxID=1751298 RepID=A0A8J3C3B5_9ACTN|nr:endonuclease/exonuclease/phosphatase family protein [Mangrovihabitans endophyticus]GGL01053.1 endonuclease [Mangrovihabitans endophyticus]
MVLRVASINLHCGLDRRAEPYSVKQAVAALDADVILIQENWRPDDGTGLAATAAADCAYPHVAERELVSGRTPVELEIVRGDSPALATRGSWGLAVISRVPWTRAGEIAIGAARGDVVGPRYAQVVQIGGLRLVNVHLTHRLAHGPAQLRALLAGLAGDDTPTVIAGDLNMCRPTIALARPYRPVARGRTWPAHLPLAQLDHVLAGPGVTVTDARVGPAVGSDHLPVLVSVAPAG